MLTSRSERLTASVSTIPQKKGSKKGLSFSSPSCGGEEIWEAVFLGKLFLVMEFVLVYTKWVQKLTVR